MASGPAEATSPPRFNVERKVELKGMPFRQPVLTEAETAALDRFLADLRPVSIGAVIVTGHSDRLERQSTPGLATARAIEVVDYLVYHGLDPKLIFWQESEPPRARAIETACPDSPGARELIECLGSDRAVTIEVVGSAPGRWSPQLRRYIAP